MLFTKGSHNTKEVSTPQTNNLESSGDHAQ